MKYLTFFLYMLVGWCGSRKNKEEGRIAIRKVRSQYGQGFT